MQMFDAAMIEKGRQIGLQEGKQEALAFLALRLLQRRIGNVPEKMQARIQALPAAQLEDLGEACLDFNQADDLTAWLEKHELSLQRFSDGCACALAGRDAAGITFLST
jgi:hypothetical protein